MIDRETLQKINELFRKIANLNNDMMLVRDGSIGGGNGAGGDMLKSIYDTNDDEKVDIAEMLKGVTAKTYGSVDIWGDKGGYIGINLFTTNGTYTGTFMIRTSDYASGMYVEGIGWKWKWSGAGVLETGTIPLARLKLSTGSYTQDIPKSSNGTEFVTNKYAHQIEAKGESANIRLLTGPTYAVTTSWVAKKYQMNNTHVSTAKYAYARWSYHSASLQAIWGIWDKDQKRLTCVLVEEDEGYCKLYPELKENQKLIKIKKPEEYKGLFAWDIMKLSKENKIKEEELEEIKEEKNER